MIEEQFEIAADGPDSTADEALETLGEQLALPPFLEPHRARIEAGLKPARDCGVSVICAKFPVPQVPYFTGHDHGQVI